MPSCSNISVAMRYQCVAAQWQKLVGQLGHLVFLCCIDYTIMSGLHMHAQKGQEIEQGMYTITKLNHLSWASLKRWAHTLTSS